MIYLYLIKAQARDISVNLGGLLLLLHHIILHHIILHLHLLLLLLLLILLLLHRLLLLLHPPPPPLLPPPLYLHSIKTEAGHRSVHTVPLLSPPSHRVNSLVQNIHLKTWQ